MMDVKPEYVKPEVEIIEFVLEESIAESSGALWYETIWGE
jgi:hypothetical protein